MANCSSSLSLESQPPPPISTTAPVNWSDLPPELLLTIASNLQTLADYIRFRAVCRNWLGAAPLYPTRHLPLEFPWLMLPLSRRSSTSTRLGFLNPHTKHLHRLILPEALRRRRAGSSHGWLTLIDDSPSILLINPLTRAKITLPPLSSFPNVLNFDFYTIGREYTLRSPEGELYYCNLIEMRDFFIKKIVLSHSPGLEPNFFAFAILNRHENLAYCRNGDSSWRIVTEARGYSEDVIYFRGAFYAVDKNGSIAICDVSSDDGELVVRFVDVEERIGGDVQYLVDAMGELMLVSRYVEFEIDVEHYAEVCRTVRFRVYRLNWSERRWEGVESLGSMVLFLGENSSFARLASDFQGCRGDRIYFTDDYSGVSYDGVSGDHDVGVYDLVDGSIEALPCYPRDSHRPIWLTPSLC